MKKIGLFFAGMIGTATSAFAAIDLSTVTVDLTAFEDVALVVVPALLTIWGVRKVIKLSNRS